MNQIKKFDGFTYNNFNKNNLNIPLYYISTRDSFAYDLDVKVSKFKVLGREITKKEFFFKKGLYPANFKNFI